MFSGIYEGWPGFKEGLGRRRFLKAWKIYKICYWQTCWSSSSKSGKHLTSRERLRKVLRKKHLQNYTSSTSSHLHLCTITFSPISLLVFTSAFLHLCSSSRPHIYISAHLHLHSHIDISAHVHICTSTSLLIFAASHLHLCSPSHPHIYISHFHRSLFLVFSL